MSAATTQASTSLTVTQPAADSHPVELVQHDPIVPKRTSTRSRWFVLAFLVFLVLNMLSGGATPLDSMPPWLQSVIQLSPAAHFVNTALAILYRGADFAAVAPEMLLTAAIGALFFVVALTRFRKMIAIVQMRGV